ncbi:MAG: NAD-dependent epimerase/dehydratase family protein [Alphaproteobacteria bacterium]
MTVVAILGARGQIARGIVAHLPREWDLRLFSRDPERPHAEARERGVPVLANERFGDGRYDVVLNAAGSGDPVVHRALGAGVLRMTETLDNLVLDHLVLRPETAYLYLSTGAIYGAYDPNYDNPVADDPYLCLPLDRLGKVNPYVVAKLAAETKHRHLSGLRIADLRIFGYFSRHMDPGSGFFLAQAAAALGSGRPFHTHPTDFVRDLVSPEDLAGQIAALVAQDVPNDAYDAVSAKPVTKFEILDNLRAGFGLEYVVDGGAAVRFPSPDRVTSLSGRQKRVTYHPRMTSLELVLREMACFPVRTGPGAACDGNADGTG